MRIEVFLKQSPVFQVNRASRTFNGYLARILSERDISFLEALVLVAVFFEDSRPVQPSSLAQTLSTTRGNISHCVSSLEAKGLIRRRLDPEDARSLHLILKPQGRKSAIEVIRTFDQMQRQIERRVGAAEIQAALSVIRQVEDCCGSIADAGRTKRQFTHRHSAAALP